MKRGPLGSSATLLALAASLVWAASPAAAGTHVRVSPGTGGIHTKFVMRFSIPNATGTFNRVNVSDDLAVRGPSRDGCVSELGQSLRPAGANTAFTVSFDPAHHGERWCAGRYSGQLVQRTTPVCDEGPPAQIVCPMYVLAPQVLGRFRFTVTAGKQ